MSERWRRAVASLTAWRDGRRQESAYLGRMDAYFAKGDKARGKADQEKFDELMKD